MSQFALWKISVRGLIMGREKLVIFDGALSQTPQGWLSSDRSADHRCSPWFNNDMTKEVWNGF